MKAALPFNKAIQGHNKKRKLQTNISVEHRPKNPQQILANRIEQRWKNSSTSANQSMCYTTLIKWRINHNIISTDTEKAFDQHSVYQIITFKLWFHNIWLW